MFTQTRTGAVLVVTCRGCNETHRGSDITARTFKRTHQCPEPEAAA